MSRLALALAVVGLAVAILPSPSYFVAIGFAIGAIGTGVIGYARRSTPGVSRLVSAGAITLGSLGLVLGILRVILTIGAIDHIERMVTS